MRWRQLQILASASGWAPRRGEHAMPPPLSHAPHRMPPTSAAQACVSQVLELGRAMSPKPRLANPADPLTVQDPLFMLYTSGSTGQPKPCISCRTLYSVTPPSRILGVPTSTATDHAAICTDTFSLHPFLLIPRATLPQAYASPLAPVSLLIHHIVSYSGCDAPYLLPCTVSHELPVQASPRVCCIPLPGTCWGPTPASSEHGNEMYEHICKDAYTTCVKMHAPHG